MDYLKGSREPLLRKARAGDLAFIREKAAEWKLDDERLAVEQFLVAEDAGGRLAGFGRVKPYSNFFELGTVGVAVDWRGRGLGSMLVEALIADFPADDVWITTDLVSYFERLGFETTDNGPRELTEKIASVCRVKGRVACRMMLRRRSQAAR